MLRRPKPNGNAPQSSERENTIRLLEYELHNTLAELLTKEAAEICTTARKEMAKGRLSASTISEVNRALELLERAEKLGSNRAAKQAEAARELLARSARSDGGNANEAAARL